MDHLALLQSLIDRGASDLHCKAGSAPAFRVAGELVGSAGEPMSAEAVALLAQAMLSTDQQQALLRDGSVVAAYAAPGIGRFRVAVFRQRGAASVVVHAGPQAIRPLDTLDLPAIATTFAGLDRGLVLLASPGGNGATTTLAALVDYVNANRPAHVICVDEPTEIVHADRRGLVSQLEVPHDVASLAEGVRAAARLDADVIAVSELRDRDVAVAALDAVARGRLVFAVMGGDTVRNVCNAFLELFTFQERPIIRSGLARALAGVLVQRLLTGTDGQPLLVAETLVRTAKIEAILADESRTGDLGPALADGTFHGMQTMDQALRDRVRAGRLDEATALAMATDPEELRIELLRL